MSCLEIKFMRDGGTKSSLMSTFAIVLQNMEVFMTLEQRSTKTECNCSLTHYFLFLYNTFYWQQQAFYLIKFYLFLVFRIEKEHDLPLF